MPRFSRGRLERGAPDEPARTPPMQVLFETGAVPFWAWPGSCSGLVVFLVVETENVILFAPGAPGMGVAPLAYRWAPMFDGRPAARGGL